MIPTLLTQQNNTFKCHYLANPPHKLLVLRGQRMDFSGGRVSFLTQLMLSSFKNIKLYPLLTHKNRRENHPLRYLGKQGVAQGGVEGRSQAEGSSSAPITTHKTREHATNKPNKGRVGDGGGWGWGTGNVCSRELMFKVPSVSNQESITCVHFCPPDFKYI